MCLRSHQPWNGYVCSAQTFAAFQRFSGLDQTACQRHGWSLPSLPFCGTEFAPTLCHVALLHAKTECVPCALDVGRSQPCNLLCSCCWDSSGSCATGCVRHVDFTTMRGDAFPVGSVASTNRMICVPATPVYFFFSQTNAAVGDMLVLW